MSLYRAYFAPGMVDPWGLYTLSDARKSLRARKVKPLGPFYGDGQGHGGNLYSAQQVFDEWYRLEKKEDLWWVNLDRCPCKLSFWKRERVCVKDSNGKVIRIERTATKMDSPVNPDPSKWDDPIVPSTAEASLYPGAKYSMRSKEKDGRFNQCIYDGDLNLITTPPGAGTVDFKKARTLEHYDHDVAPIVVANSIDKDGNGQDPGMFYVIFGFVKMKNPIGSNVKKYYEVRPTWHKDCPKNP